ncbi:chloride channel protein, CIC family [Desulfuromusa kysingii]|uniref:Chloride channel protein, CIC family n=2 Tax=Desulfuromusa kysingii TaxID=37625 RepID=A0A1H3VY00_9BACT|nr:chloride channel protein, CIC family [Desulfuromusa kysingii]
MTFTPKILNFLDRTGFRLLILAIPVGIVAGFGALAFYFATNSVEHLMLGKIGNFHPPLEGTPESSFTHFIDSLSFPYRWCLFLLPALGGLLSGWLVYTFAPEAEGHGTDAAIEAFHRKGGVIRGRVPIIKTFASVITIGTGGSAGREGPIAQIGAGFGSFMATKLGLSAQDRRLLLMAGMAGGIGATFRSPLGGALFAAEVLYRDPDFEHEGLIPCIISSIIAYSLFGAITGWAPLLDTPLFLFNKPSELLLYLGLGIICALFGVFYVKFFYGMRDLFRQLALPNWLKPALGGLLLGILAMFVPQVLGSGYGWVQAALYGQMALWVMLVVAIAKVVATSLTISSGGSGGVFAPSLVIGAMLGGTFGATAEILFPMLVQDPRAYVLVGMAGFFAGVSNAPVATLIMVSELTGNYSLLAPLMLVCVVAMIVMRKNSIYEKQVASRFDSPAHLGDFVIDILEGVKIQSIAAKGSKPTLIPEGMTLPDILDKIAPAKTSYYPVVNAEQQMVGIFSMTDIRRILNDDIPPTLVIAGDIATRNVITATPDECLTDVMKKLTARNLDEIPVVATDTPQQVLYMMSRRSLLAHYAEQMEKTKTDYQRT